MKMKKVIDIKCPSVPNFILNENSNNFMSISEFTDEELREIGKQWIEELVKKAKSKRNPF